MGSTLFPVNQFRRKLHNAVDKGDFQSDAQFERG